ncbi:MAG: Chaperone SurA precursor [Pseudomonadota bacterium]
MAARHVLVAWRGASQARPEISRTRDEARARAEEALRQVRAGEPFDRVARTTSDDPSASWGGDLGSFEPGVMATAFESAVAALPIGGLGGPVETPYGFHVVERLPVRDIRARHLVVTWKDAERAPASVTRTRDEARAMLAAAVAALDAGEPWDSVVARTSDGPSRETGGDLGWFTRGQLMPLLDDAVFDLAPGAHTAILETPRGFHVLQRVD